MQSRYRLLACLAPLGILMFTVNSAHSDEGMWLFNQPPTKILKDRHNFDVNKEWLEHLQKSSVRFNTGGSGSFVSADGLVMTNHHVGADQLQKMSTKEKDYMKDGFYAKSPAEEVKSPDLELNVLMEIEDVTDRVNAAVKPDMDAAAAQKARKAVMNTIEKESTEKTGLRSDVVTLFQGGMYHLYRYKKYTDVRLVFAPEKAIAFFGGDPDNFEYPRYDLDICFFRVYENDKPVKPQHYLKWSDAGCKDGELVFVSGHPGQTDRLNTVKHLQFLRDTAYPLVLDFLRRKEVLLKTFGDRSKENMRRAEETLFSIQNSRKARLGGLAGLQDPALMKKKEAEEIIASLTKSFTITISSLALTLRHSGFRIGGILTTIIHTATTTPITLRSTIIDTGAALPQPYKMNWRFAAFTTGPSTESSDPEPARRSGHFRKRIGCRLPE